MADGQNPRGSDDDRQEIADRIDRRMSQIWSDLQRGRDLLAGKSADVVTDYHKMEAQWLAMHTTMVQFNETHLNNPTRSGTT